MYMANKRNFCNDCTSLALSLLHCHMILGTDARFTALASTLMRCVSEIFSRRNIRLVSTQEWEAATLLTGALHYGWGEPLFENEDMVLRAGTIAQRLRATLQREPINVWHMACVELHVYTAPQPSRTRDNLVVTVKLAK